MTAIAVRPKKGSRAGDDTHPHPKIEGQGKALCPMFFIAILETPTSFERNGWTVP
jgi:hypothetical protein